MAHRSRLPMTRAVRALREAGIPYDEHPYAYVEKGGTAAVAQGLGVEEHHVVKTLVFEDDQGTALLVLMHGDRSVSTKELARVTGAKRITPAAPERAERDTGYRVGGISPFGTRITLPVCVEETILRLPRIYINGGHRGFIVGMDPSGLAVLHPTPVCVGLAARPQSPA
ncbi:MAG: aminoacyl-tRNA deacylase [Lentisphaeria bacterium]|nr:aminoacyl-tRNA deacylase [Lentisphaeria bacterium]